MRSNRPEARGAPSFIKSYGLESRIDVRSGNFFESIPSGADAYLLKHILHDWSDEDWLCILKNICAVAEPGTKLLIVDAVIGARNEHEFAKILDIQMLVHLCGKERTHTELLYAAGFQLTRVVPTPSFAHIVEAVRIKYRAGRALRRRSVMSSRQLLLLRYQKAASFGVRSLDCGILGIE